jgi:transcriptional regulator with XRE-family HTH domain
MITVIKTGEKIKHHRENLGITQKLLGDALGIREGTVSNYERGKTTPSFPMLKSIAILLRVDYRELMDEKYLQDLEEEIEDIRTQVLIQNLIKERKTKLEDIPYILKEVEEYFKETLSK